MKALYANLRWYRVELERLQTSNGMGEPVNGYFPNIELLIDHNAPHTIARQTRENLLLQ